MNGTTRGATHVKGRSTLIPSNMIGPAVSCPTFQRFLVTFPGARRSLIDPIPPSLDSASHVMICYSFAFRFRPSPWGGEGIHESNRELHLTEMANVQ